MTRLDARTLDLLAAGIAASGADVLVAPGTERRWTLVHSNQAFEAWVIAWPPGTGLALHDHRGSAAAVRVVAGRLRERYRTAASGDHELASRWLAEGTTHLLDDDHVHELVNTDGVEAVTIHVYSPPLAAGDYGPEFEIQTLLAESRLS